MYSKILVALDGSANSRKALDHAIGLAEKSGAKITLIHVYSVIVPLVPAGDVLASPTTATPAFTAVADKLTMETEKLGAKILDDAEKVVKERGISVDKVLREGDIVKEIVAEAQKGGYDLIVLGHRGMSRLGELLLGAVSEGVSHKAPCPVLIVK